MKKSLRAIRKRLHSRNRASAPAKHSPGDYSVLNVQEYGRYTHCRCTDRYGMPKKLYASTSQAREAAMHESLKIYPCPFELGWHLSAES